MYLPMSTFRINALERYWRNLGQLCSYGVIYDRVAESELHKMPSISIWELVFDTQRLCDNLKGDPSWSSGEGAGQDEKSRPHLPPFDRRK